MKGHAIDINSDVGEGVGNEALLLPLISSCNIACGAHAGDEHTMRRVVQLAKKHKVKIGAHPGFPDRANFGRKTMNIDQAALSKSIIAQINLLARIVQEENAVLRHIKAHGALYNSIAKNEQLALTFLKAILPYKESVYLYVPYGTLICTLAFDMGFQIKTEAFADRNYNLDLSLVSRALDNAIIHEPDMVLAHVLNMVKSGSVQTIENVQMPMKADTYCVHGDTASALEILMYLSQELPKHQVQINK